jgi:hypothetical protein
MIVRAAARAALRESGRDLAKIIRDADGCVDVGKSKVHVDLSLQYEFGTDIEYPIYVLCLAFATDEAREPTTYPGTLRTGRPIWKSGMAPELTEPVRLAEMLNCASMLPSSPARISQPRPQLLPMSSAHLVSSQTRLFLEG